MTCAAPVISSTLAPRAAIRASSAAVWAGAALPDMIVSNASTA